MDEIPSKKIYLFMFGLFHATTDKLTNGCIPRRVPPIHPTNKYIPRCHTTIHPTTPHDGDTTRHPVPTIPHDGDGMASETLTTGITHDGQMSRRVWERTRVGRILSLIFHERGSPQLM